MDAITFPPAPTNEPNLTYAPGTPEREALVTELERFSGARLVYANLEPAWLARMRTALGEPNPIAED